jgi:predicted DNA-binding transcriptional regulator AlpA
MANRRPLRSDDDILTAPAAAQIAGLDRAHFRRIIREGKGPKHQTVRAGKRDMVLILRHDLEAWLKGREA